MIDYLAVGHVTDDLWADGGVTPGGTVMYSSRCARAFTGHVTVLTAAAAALDVAGIFPGIDVVRIDSPNTTQFWNVYDGSHRTQFTHPSPVVLAAEHMTHAMRHAEIVHLAPVCNEASVDITRVLAKHAFLGLTPQGWLRRWDAEGKVTQSPGNWSDAPAFLARANAVVMSIEDINGDWQTAHKWAAQTRLLVVTQSEAGCTLFLNGETVEVPAPQVEQVDPTGAGDIFAATLFISLKRGDSARDAAARANCIAAQSVTRKQMAGLPTPADFENCGVTRG